MHQEFHVINGLQIEKYQANFVKESCSVMVNEQFHVQNSLEVSIC